MSKDAWVAKIEKRIEQFSRQYGSVYSRSERELSASFEIGCLHLLTNDYAERATLTLQNLTSTGAFRYLTTPAGNPANFSWIKIQMKGQEFQLRQQVRLGSHLDPDIAFTPDIIVLDGSATIRETKDQDFAKGKRRFFTATAQEVIAAHECKSLVPFPELLVSFIGIFIAAHPWLNDDKHEEKFKSEGKHLAPCLFVGGASNALQRRMVRALERVYPINILTGLHDTQWRFENNGEKLRYI